LVEVNLTIEELDMVQSWGNMLFGGYEPNRPGKKRIILRPTDSDLDVMRKIGFMRLQIVQNLLEELKKDDYTWGGDD
jgi:hypothetical protein